MNFRNDNYYRQILMRSLEVKSYGNLYFLSTRIDNVLVTAVNPSREELVSAYLLYQKLKDDLSTLQLYYRFYIRRGRVEIELSPRGWRITISQLSSLDYQLTIKRIYVKAYGALVFKTLFSSPVSLTSIILTIKKFYLK